MYKLSDKIRSHNKKTLEFASHHSQFHYISSDTHLNLAKIFRLLGNSELTTESIKKSLQMYPNNLETLNFKDSENFDSNKIRYTKTKDINFKMIVSNKELIILQKRIDLNPNIDLNELKKYYIKILKIIDNLHHKYHIELAERYFDLASLYINESLISEGRIFIEKAIETDKNNPNNEKYKKLLLTLENL